MNDYIGDILKKIGCRVSSAFNGVAAMDAIRSRAPHLVILDIFMPEKDGLEVLVELRRLSPALPVLVISGKQHLLSGSSMSLATQLGASDILAKPFTPKELLNHVTRLAGILDAQPSEPLPGAQSELKGFAKLRQHLGRWKQRFQRTC